MERKKRSEHLRYLVLTAIFAAMVYVLTAFVKIPTHQGYIHVGDRNTAIVCKRNMFAVIPAAVICIGGYYLAAVILYGDWGAALIDIPTNALQSVASAALFLFLGLSLDKAGFKKRFLLSGEKKKTA